MSCCFCCCSGLYIQSIHLSRAPARYYYVTAVRFKCCRMSHVHIPAVVTKLVILYSVRCYKFSECATAVFNVHHAMVSTVDHMKCIYGRIALPRQPQPESAPQVSKIQRQRENENGITTSRLLEKSFDARFLIFSIKSAHVQVDAVGPIYTFACSTALCAGAVGSFNVACCYMAYRRT